jgi:hypothetical protein
VSNESREGNEVFGAAQAQQGGFQTVNIMRDEFGYETPVDLVPLPSKGMIYPAESPIHGQETVEVRSMTAKEEDILTSRALIKKGTVITELIKSCLTNKSINVDDMIAGDRNAIMTALRITGYGAEYSVEIDCPACDERQSAEFSLTDLPMKYLEIQPVSPGANLFEFELPVSKKKVHFKFLTGKDESEMSIISDRQKKQGSRVDSLVTRRLEFSIVAVDNITERSKIGHFIRNMPARDSLSLRKYMDKSEPGIDMKSWLSCVSCDEQSEVRLPLGANFFWPDTE